MRVHDFHHVDHVGPRRQTVRRDAVLRVLRELRVDRACSSYNSLVTKPTAWILFVMLLVPASALAQSAQADQRPTGLPSKIDWTFNFTAGWGSFGFGNSLFLNPKVPDVATNLSDQWFEGFVKPALSGTFKWKSASEIYGRLSAVGERTYGSAPAVIVGRDASSFGVE